MALPSASCSLVTACLNTNLDEAGVHGGCGADHVDIGGGCGTDALEGGVGLVIRKSRRNSRKTTWFPRHRKMRPLPATASQGKSP